LLYQNGGVSLYCYTERFFDYADFATRLFSTHLLEGISMKRILFLTILSAALVLAGCGGGSSSTTIAANPAGAGFTTVNFGDATNDQIIAFELSISAITLNGGSNPSVLAKPTEFEFVHAAGTMEPLSLVNVPAGTYTGATITVANPEVVVINAGVPTKIPATLTSATINVTFSPAITIGAGASVLNFDLNLANSVTLNGVPPTSATVNPQFTATTAAVPTANNGNEDEDHGEFEDVRGSVTSVASPNFTIQPAQSAQPITFVTNSSTQFKDGITSLAQLTNGMIVSVDSVTQSDGTLLATKVEAETESANGEEIEGLVTAVTGSPATQITVSTQVVSATSTANAPTFGNPVTVPVSNGTRFVVKNGKLNVPAGQVFDATHIANGQRVEVDNDNEGQAGNSTSNVSADKLKLTEQALTGAVAATPAPSSTGFTLTLDSTSAFSSLTGATSITVITSSSTEVKNVTVTGNTSVRVRGLLFVNGTAYTLVAERISQP
jgi:hypothetical protein